MISWNPWAASKVVAEPQYLFVLNPAYCGSTAFIHFLLSSQKAAAAAPDAEGQWLPSVRRYMEADRWNPAKSMPWEKIKRAWLKEWNANKRRLPKAEVLIEKSPPNLLRAAEIEKAFPDTRFIIWMRNPYAWCASIQKREQTQRLSHAAWAEQWLLRAQAQRWNVENLHHTLRLSYEEFVDDVVSVKEKVASFCHTLDDLDVNIRMKVKDYPVSGVVDHNVRQIAGLGQSNVEAITAVLRRDEDLVKFFGYELAANGKA